MPNFKLEFDVVIGISDGHSMLCVADFVEVNKKVGRIRTEYRVLNRENEMDRLYFREMDDIILVTQACKDIFLQIFPETASKVEVMYNVLPFEMYNGIPSNTKKSVKKNKYLNY